MHLEQDPDIRRPGGHGRYYNGMHKPCYFFAVYEHLDDDLSCEGTIGLREVSGVDFEDEGHAIAWALA